MCGWVGGIDVKQPYLIASEIVYKKFAKSLCQYEELSQIKSQMSLPGKLILLSIWAICASINFVLLITYLSLLPKG